MRVSILTGPFEPVQRSRPGQFSGPGRVSILTGPFGPVQPYDPYYNAYRGGVSILTGPFGPVQHDPEVHGPARKMFQSSPALSGRCNSR